MFAAELTGFPAPLLPETPARPSRDASSAGRLAPSRRRGIVVTSGVVLVGVAVYAAVYAIVAQLSVVVFSALLRPEAQLALLEIDAGVLVCAAALFGVARTSRMARHVKAAPVKSNIYPLTDPRFKASIPSVSDFRETLRPEGADVSLPTPFSPLEIEVAG